MGFLDGLAYYAWGDGHYELLTCAAVDYSCVADGPTASIELQSCFDTPYLFDLETGLINGYLSLVDEHFEDSVGYWFPGYGGSGP